MELTILMPCLNEAETLRVCICKAKAFLAEHGVSGEVLIADNGSTDGSQAIAEAEGARVEHVPERGYGAALIGGINAAHGKFVIMGDADDSYDFSRLMPFLERLRAGADVVMGNRFQGGIAPGAMPFLHKYLGNPVLSWFGRLFFGVKVGDFHCGLRGFDRNRIRALNLRTMGMEFASELLVRASLADYRIEEVPTTLNKDGRSRPPHLRTWRDGWRHMSFLLMYSPRWLFLYPGLALMATGAIIAFVLFPGPVKIGNIGFDTHTFVVSSFLALLGVQAIGIAAIARKFAVSQEFLPPSRHFSALLDLLTLERMLIASCVFIAVGLAGFLWSFFVWASTGFGPLGYDNLVRYLVVSMTAIAIGIQGIFIGFLSAIMEIPTR